MDIDSSESEEVRKLRAEVELLKKEIQKRSEEEEKIKKLEKHSRQAWIKKQISSNIFEDAIDKIQEHYEKKLGINDE